LALAVFRMKGHYAAIITLALSMIVAVFGFEMPVNMVFASAEYGFLFGLWPIAWIIVASVFLYKLTVKSGQFEIIRNSIISITEDQRIQVILIGFSFGAFLECEQLLDKKPDVVTPNGFEDDFVPAGKLFETKRTEARQSLRKVAETLLGYSLDEDALFVSTAGRYEYKNKGIDTFIESLKHLYDFSDMKRQVVAFIMVPARVKKRKVIRFFICWTVILFFIRW
jgi:hypothetical protein